MIRRIIEDFEISSDDSDESDEVKREKRAWCIFVNYLYDFVLIFFSIPNMPFTILVYLMSSTSNIKSKSLNNCRQPNAVLICAV